MGEATQVEGYVHIEAGYRSINSIKAKPALQIEVGPV